jgi:hypothetical protein
MAKPAPNAGTARATAGTEQLGPPEPPGVWGSFWQKARDVLATGYGTATDVYTSGLKHAAEGGWLPGASSTQDPTKGLQNDKVGALGWLEMMSALPSGVGAAVQRAMQKYTPGLENTPMPGLGGRRDPNDRPTVASYLRTLIALPQILLDPKMQGFSWPELARALDDPITSDELRRVTAR